MSARQWSSQSARFGYDSAAWILGIGVAYGARYDWKLSAFLSWGILAVIPVVLVAQVLLGRVTHLYRGRHDLGTIEEASALAVTMGATALVLQALVLVPSVTLIPRSVPIPAAIIALALAAAVRLVTRVRREARARPDPGAAQRVLIYGAGRTGEQLVRSMLSDDQAGLLPVAILDDDLALARRRVHGVPVVGTGDCITEAVRVHRVALVVVAMRRPQTDRVREAVSRAEDLDIGVKSVRPLGERLKPTFEVADLRDLDVSTLLGRSPVDTDVVGLAAQLTGRCVLVTGAGGSIGAELCRQVARYDPSELLMLDRDESALHALQLSIYGKALLDSPDVILADIRDRETVRRIFRDRRPEVVFHAAALKHLPLLEQYPEEAWKSNVLGTINVLDAAAASGVDRLVNISTDKAADPTSVLGRSKRIGERLVAWHARRVPGTFVSVRFGNVLGSRGSVLTTFREQIAAGAPLTVTHPEVTRFFMTIPEAVHLVVQAAAIGSRGEVLVLDMGAQVRIVDVARQLMRRAAVTVPIVFTGLRSGEKLHEELFGAGESDHRPEHPLISHAWVPPLDVEVVAGYVPACPVAVALAKLAVDDQEASLPLPRDPSVTDLVSSALERQGSES
jgi:FlaA1/EpsC-like NDP-sugar epimerase